MLASYVYGPIIVPMTDKNDPISLQCADIVMDLYGCSRDVPFLQAADKIGGLVDGLEAELQAARAEVERLREQVHCPQQSESGIRTRRGELVQLGLVRQVGTATKANGRKAVVWGIA